MLVFAKQKLVLLAVPKTGTTALEGALLPHASAAILDPPGLKHVSVSRYRAALEPFFTQRGRRPLELMAIMREPVDWLGSWYRYRRRRGLSGHENSTESVSFDDFVEAWLRDRPPAFANVGSQARFLGGGTGACAVPHLFRFDRIERAVRFLETRLDTKLTLERRNVSPPMELSLSPGMLDRLRAERPEEFELWDRLPDD